MQIFLLAIAIFFFVTSLALNCQSYCLLIRALKALRFSLDLYERNLSEDDLSVQRMEGTE